VRDCIRMLVATSAIAVPIAFVTPFVMLLVINVFFDGLDALDPITTRLGAKATLLLYAIAWVAVIRLFVWLMRRTLRSKRDTTGRSA
jgi:uncharacterized BrkB/YihY/UPF0761 family membrane protein